MHSNTLLYKCFFLLFLLNFFIYPQTKPQISYYNLIINAEQNPDLRLKARELAAKMDLPISIYLPQGVFIEAIGIENNKPVYSIINNLVNPWENGEAAFADEVLNRYDLAEARVHYGNGRVANPMLGYSYQPHGVKSEAVSLLLVPDGTADKVLAFDADNGNLVDLNFIPSNNPNMQTPKEALLNKFGFITVSDQISDLVQKYDTSGAYIGFFAPASGVNTAILDNIRGHNYRANGNLVVCVGSGGNQNSVAEFDQSGNYLGQFIATGAGGLTSPFDIIFRTNDALVTTSTASGVYRYTLNGAPINVMVPGLSFAQQIQELDDKRLAVAEFSGTGSGIRLYDSSGVFIKRLAGVTGNRGVHQLKNGNFLTTNGTGVYEIDSASGSSIRTVVSGVSAQYVTPYDPSMIIPYTLNLTAIIEGFYNETTMVPDTLEVYLRQPSTWEKKDSVRISLDTLGNGSGEFNSIPLGNYYLSINHRNSIETWSKLPQQFTLGSLTYDLTNSSDKAFGDNMKLKGTKWCIFSGDVNQDGVVDLTDVAIVDTDNLNFVSGYVVSDVNGDQVSDLSDVALVDTNNLNFVSKVTPGGVALKRNKLQFDKKVQ